MTTVMLEPTPSTSWSSGTAGTRASRAARWSLRGAATRSRAASARVVEPARTAAPGVPPAGAERVRVGVAATVGRVGHRHGATGTRGDVERELPLVVPRGAPVRTDGGFLALAADADHACRGNVRLRLRCCCAAERCCARPAWLVRSGSCRAACCRRRSERTRRRSSSGPCISCAGTGSAPGSRCSGERRSGCSRS